MSNEHEESIEILNVFFQQWKAEHQELERFVRGLSEWTNQAAQEQTLQFREAARRIRGLGDRLSQHFEKEHAIGSLLAESRGVATPEIEAVQRQADKDHAVLTARLQKLVEMLDSAEQTTTLWKKAMYEFNLFIDVLEQHEELEAESVRWLIPTIQPH